MARLNPYTENRPWGNFVEFVKNTPCTVKIITVNPGQSLSLQTHSKREEFWRVVSGKGTIIIGEESLVAEVGKEFFVPLGAAHRMSADADSTLVILEIGLGEFDENDIIRLKDDYGRSV